MSSSDLRVRVPMAEAIRRPARHPFGGGPMIFDMGFLHRNHPPAAIRNPLPGNQLTN